MKLELGYGKGTQAVAIPDGNLMGILRASPTPSGPAGEAAVREALKNPIGSPRLSELVGPGERVAIVTSDLTRPVPSHLILPPVLEGLFAAGVRPEDVTVVFALGSHRPQTPEEMRRLAGEAVFGRVRCVNSDPEDFIHMGTTRMGTPVEITRVVAEADRRVAVGNIEYHYFAGYSGGAKAILPGVSTRAAIQANHSRMVLPQAAAGRLEGNPVRMDMEEAVGFCPLDFIVNVVLDERKRILFAAAGHFIEAHRAGCRFLDSIYRAKIPARADIVIASPGGAPKDINLYQTQKALDNAKYAVRDGGIVILAGACPEGPGEQTFERWMRESDSADSLIDRIRRGFELGGHKAAAIAMVLKRSDIYLVSELDPELVRRFYMRPYRTVQEALAAALQKLGADAKVLVMPNGGATLPLLESGSPRESQAQ